MDLINILFAKALNNGDTTKEYVDEAIKALKGEVNADLDTLEELSKALGNDPDFFLTIKNEIDGFKTELVTNKDAATENTRFAIGVAEQSLEVPSMEEFNQLKDEKLSEPAEGLAVGKYFRVAALDASGHAVLEAVDAPKEGLAITPTGWPEWTADEQAAARERMGEFTDIPLTTVADITLDESATILRAQLAKPCRFVTCTFIIPTESTGQNRNIYFAANLDGVEGTTAMFTRSGSVSTSATNCAFYFAPALIIGGKILSFGCMASTGTSITDHQTRALNNPPNAYCVLDAENFESISVYTFGNAFPAASQLVVTGC